MSAVLKELARLAEQEGFSTWASRWTAEAKLVEESGLDEKLYPQKTSIPQEAVSSGEPSSKSLSAIPTVETTSPSSVAEQLREEYKAKFGKEIVIPQPRQELLEIHRILQSEGFNMDPLVYIRGKEEVAYALVDRSMRPNYDNGRQLFEDDGFVPILERGREMGKDGGIEVTSWTRHVPAKSRFGVSWNEVHTFVAQEMVQVSPHLARLVEATKAQVRVPTQDEFQFAGRLRYAHFGKADTWEHLYDASEHGRRLVGGGSGCGGLAAVGGCPPDGRDGGIAFRLQMIFPSQKAA